MKITACIATSMILFSSATLAAEVDADSYIKYREGLMESAKNHSAGIGDILKGKLDLKANLIHHARALDETVGLFASAYPEGSDFGETRAKAEVWENPEGFAAAAKQSKEATAALLKAAEGGDIKAIGAAMADVGKSCKGCHKEFRAKK